VADDKHAHDWIEDRKITVVSGKKWITTTYYHCSGCPLPKQETEEKGK
jgi:hypothetical protein